MLMENDKQVSPSFIQFLNDSNNYTQTIENLKNLDLPPEIFAQYINFMQTAPVSILFMDQQQNILFTNKTIEYKLQKSQKELIGKSLADVLPIHLTEADQQEILLEVTANQSWSGTVSYLTEEDKVKKVWLKVSIFKSPSGAKSFGVLFFDSENINYRDFGSHTLSYYDTKTFLPNFNQLSFDLNQLILKKDPAAKGMALIRCQNLSNITAYHSRKMMDKVTMTMVRRIKEVLPKGYFLYRLSRDVFSVFSTRFEEEKEFQSLVEQIQQSLLDPLQIEENQIFLTNEIGVAFYPSQVKALNQLLLSAEICLNQRDTSKIIYYSEKIHREYILSIQTIEKLQTALDENKIKLLYKPIIALTGDLYAAEAVIDWQDEELGSIAPLDILKRAKEYGHVHKLTQWILDTIARDQLFKDTVVAIKLDTIQIVDQFLLPEILQHLENQTLDPKKIIFEITELEKINRCPNATATLKELRRLGFRLGIDDFGMGYSDFSLLTDLDIEIIKIDPIFVAGVTKEPKKAILLKHLFLLAEELGLVTYFKGIQTEEELAWAKTSGFSCLQGPYFSTPLTAASFINKYLA